MIDRGKKKRVLEENMVFSEKNKENLKKFEDFLHEEELSDSTIYGYMWAMRDFFSKYEEITKANVIEWKKEMLEETSAKTTNSRLIAMRRYCDFAETSMSVKAIKIQKQNSVENVISIEQYNHLIECLEKDGNTRYAAYIRILAKTGARISEALKFTVGDIEKGFCELYTKGKVRTIKFPKSLCDEISPLYEGRPKEQRLFLNFYEEPITSRGISEALKRFAVRYSIPPEVMHPHSFRHLFAIEFLKRNSNVSLLADLMGHSGLNTTMIYLRLSKEQQQQELDRAVNW